MISMRAPKKPFKQEPISSALASGRNGQVEWKVWPFVFFFCVCFLLGVSCFFVKVVWFNGVALDTNNI